MNISAAANYQVNKHYAYDYYDDGTLSSAKEVFKDLQMAGIIKESSSFADDIWNMTDERTNTRLSFVIDPFTMNRFCELLHEDRERIIAGLKAYIISILNQLVLHSVQTLLNEIRRVIRAVCFENEEAMEIHFSGYIIDYLSSLLGRNESSDADDQIARIIKTVEEQAVKNSSAKQRALSTFDSYLVFYQIIMDYWNRDIPRNERLFYYPLYLWVKIAWVIPTRPIEFLVTRRDCLRIDGNGEYYMKLRKSRIKGSSKEITHKIETDFEEIELHIPRTIGKDIQEYIDYTAEMFPTEIETLFVTTPHYKAVWNSETYNRKIYRYLTYTNMNTILRWFYEDIISVRYGYKVEYESEYSVNSLPDKTIEYIHLGDIRHISLFNIVESGSLLSAMLLAGHNDINISSHYYTNISNIVECHILRTYRKLIHGSPEYRISEYDDALMNYTAPVQLSDNQYCVSRKYAEHDFEDCCNACGPNGEIGWCDNCPYHRNELDLLQTSNTRFYEENAKHKGAIDKEAEMLRKAVDKVRRGKGYDEEIIHAVQKLEIAENLYKKFRLSQLSKTERSDS